MGPSEKPYKAKSFILAIPYRKSNSRFMTSDIKKYISLRDSLIQEKTRLENRLREINSALGQGQESERGPSTSVARVVTASRGRRGVRSGLSLREAVLQATAKGPLTKEQILDSVKKLGYRFSTNNPLNSLGVILYGKNPKFKNDAGRFSPIGVHSAKGGEITRGQTGKKRGKLSPEARARIAAAQRARWAKVKSAKS